MLSKNVNDRPEGVVYSAPVHMKDEIKVRDGKRYSKVNDCRKGILRQNVRHVRPTHLTAIRKP